MLIVVERSGTKIEQQMLQDVAPCVGLALTVEFVKFRLTAVLFPFHREAVVRGDDGTIRGTVKVKGTLNRSSKRTCITLCNLTKSCA